MIKQKQIDEIKRLRGENYSYKQIAKQLKISHLTVMKYLSKKAEGMGGDRNADNEGRNDKKNYSKVFNAFDEGKNLIEVVKGGLCSPTEVEEFWNKYNELKIKTRKDTELQKLQKEPTLIKELNERICKLEEAINTLEGVVYGEIRELILKPRPEFIKTDCKHYKEGFCKGFSWKSKPEVDENGLFRKAIQIKDKWYVDPDPRYCALCPKNTLSRE